MNKILIFLLTAVLACIIFTGCGTDAPPDTNGGSAPPSSVNSALAKSDKGKPIYGNQIKDGTYNIEVSSSSSMFRIIDAKLTVKDKEMYAVLTLSGDGYEKLYMGTKEQAEADTDDKCIYFVENADGKYTYTVPVDALDQDTHCAAWSIRKQAWYDRVLVFQSALIPENAIMAK